MSATTNGITQNYTWSTSDLLLGDGSNYYIYGPGPAPLEQVSKASGATTYLLTDQLGSVVIEADSSASITATQSYNPYGTVSSTTGSWTTPFGFAGGYRDTTGLIYLINRYYDPATGQFVSVDPLVGVTGAAYGYVGGDPVNGLDPNGMFTFNSLNPLQWLIDGLNQISNLLMLATQTLGNQASSLNKQIAQLETELAGASDPKVICNEIAVDRNKIYEIQSGLHEISVGEHILRTLYNVIADISGVAEVWSCIAGIGATIVGFITNAGEELAGAVADLLSSLISGEVSSNFIEVNILLSEVGNDVHDCATAL